METLKAIIEGGIVTNIIVIDIAKPETHDAIAGEIVPQGIPVGVGWAHNGTTFIAPAPAPITIADLVVAVQSHLDATAKARNYDSILSACSYAASTNLSFSSEGQAAVAWRDSVWLYCYQQLALVQAGTRPMPLDTASIISELPIITW